MTEVSIHKIFTELSDYTCSGGSNGQVFIGDITQLRNSVTTERYYPSLSLNNISSLTITASVSLHVHTAGVNCLSFENGLLVSAGDDQMIVLHRLKMIQNNLTVVSTQRLQIAHNAAITGFKA
jgi:hypothetical protein